MADLMPYYNYFNYIRFTFSDINGTARGKLVPARHGAQFAENGQIYAGTFAYGPENTVPFETLEADVGSKGHNNCKLVPDNTTFRSVGWTKNESEKRVAEIYCEPYWLNSNLPQPAPRNVARKMLAKLDKMGLEILSATEFEFKIYKDKDSSNRVPLFPLCEFASMLRLSLLEDLIFHLESNLIEMGIDLANVSLEYSPGQFEFVLRPLKGLEAADDAFGFKQAVTEMVLKKGYGISFMAKPDSIPGACNGAHFNFSIWNKITGKNAFFDELASDKLSAMARHWIGGIIHHAPALTALCSPTVNCYRRVHQPWAPDVSNWNYSDRSSFLRVKNEGEKSTYMENRVPSSAGNPYIVMAATIAAGIDGTIRNLLPPAPNEANAPKLPSTLAEAIAALEADKNLAEVLGTDFVRYFIGIKREIELSKFGHHDMSQLLHTELTAEILGYDLNP